MKINKEIIIEEAYIFLRKLVDDYDVNYLSPFTNEDFEYFAASLLEKLNKLNKGNVNNILIKMVNGWKNISDNSDESTRKRYTKKEKAIDQILSLIPEEGEVIVDGLKCNIKNPGEFEHKLLCGLNKHEGKKVRILIEEIE